MKQPQESARMPTPTRPKREAAFMMERMWKEKEALCPREVL